MDGAAESSTGIIFDSHNAADYQGPDHHLSEADASRSLGEVLLLPRHCQHPAESRVPRVLQQSQRGNPVGLPLL